MLELQFNGIIASFYQCDEERSCLLSMAWQADEAEEIGETWHSARRAKYSQEEPAWMNRERSDCLLLDFETGKSRFETWSKDRLFLLISLSPANLASALSQGRGEARDAFTGAIPL